MGSPELVGIADIVGEALGCVSHGIFVPYCWDDRIPGCVRVCIHPEAGLHGIVDFLDILCVGGLFAREVVHIDLAHDYCCISFSEVVVVGSKAVVGDWCS